MTRPAPAAPQADPFASWWAAQAVITAAIIDVGAVPSMVEIRRLCDLVAGLGTRP